MKYSYLVSGPPLPAGRSLTRGCRPPGLVLVAWTPHEQVAGAPLDVELTEDVAVAEQKNRILPLLDCHLVRPLSYFAAEAASYQLPSEAG